MAQLENDLQGTIVQPPRRLRYRERHLVRGGPRGKRERERERGETYREMKIGVFKGQNGNKNN